MSLLTGLYPHHHDTVDNRESLDWRYRTIAHHFAESGYLTGLIGKMHFNDACKHGFQYHLSVNDWLMYLGPKAKHYANEVANHDLIFNRGAEGPGKRSSVFDTGCSFPELARVWDGPSPWVDHVDPWPAERLASPLSADDQLDSFVARESIRFLANNRNRPFFLVASFMMPP